MGNTNMKNIKWNSIVTIYVRKNTHQRNKFWFVRSIRIDQITINWRSIGTLAYAKKQSNFHHCAKLARIYPVLTGIKHTATPKVLNKSNMSVANSASQWSEFYNILYK